MLLFVHADEWTANYNNAHAKILIDPSVDFNHL